MTAAAVAATEVRRVRRRIVLRGLVQGVGFRPFVYRAAVALDLSGWTRNAPHGLVIEVEGAPEAVARFVDSLRRAPPANAIVDGVDSEEIAATGETGFAALASETSGRVSVEIAPDLAICDDCLRELFDPADRRHLYPFINCAHCGPRFSIVEAAPYDRARTAMRGFEMCAQCRAEYEDPANRRFHAEPIACPQCGPRLSLRGADGACRAAEGRALDEAAAAVRAGKIVAAKGIGGFHLIVDARDEAAVQRLRARKRRPEKPFAVMFASLDQAKAHCRMSPSEAALLSGVERPIVLLRRDERSLAPSIAPASPWLGALLPYAPLHHLLLRDLGFPIVATSGNLSDEPIATDNDEAIERLRGVADVFLVHDRPILRPLDDSVARIVADRPLILRRARGHAPALIKVEGVEAGVVAFGGHLKNVVALTGVDSVRLSPHIGDLDGPLARLAQAHAVEDLLRLQGSRARLAARDLHPDYASGDASGLDAPVLGVQHHLAHVVACMADNGVATPVLGVAFDGAGFGDDATIWGGEFLLVSKGAWRRVAHLRGFRLPGGAQAMREPRRAALGLLFEAFGPAALGLEELAPVSSFSPSQRANLAKMLAGGLNAPWTTSAGRLFDAFAALTGLRQRASYEGQAAAELEGAAEGFCARRAYPFDVREGHTAGELVVDWLPALGAALADLRDNEATGSIAAALHLGVARAIARVAAKLGQRRVALCGGCFQNARLTEAAIGALREAGCDPLWHRRVPPNDGGLALGQAVWAAWRARGGEAPCA